MIALTGLVVPSSANTAKGSCAHDGNTQAELSVNNTLVTTKALQELQVWCASHDTDTG